MKNILIGISIILLSACSSTGERMVNEYRLTNVDRQAGKIENVNDVICTYETKPGSKIKNKHCMTRAQKERQKVIAQNFVNQALRKQSCTSQLGC